MTSFTPLTSFLGGVLIGISASLLLWMSGRIAGVSGIAGGLLSPTKGDIAWRVTFVVGLFAGGLIIRAVYPEAGAYLVERSAFVLIVAGLLVGFGTRLGNGCTSGHGVCGISRGSMRSIVATGCFMAAAILTVFLVKLFQRGAL